jgi:hypothetical protein
MPKVQINYRTGRSITVQCDEFTITRKPGNTEYQWVNMVPNPLLIGVEDIESVWEIQ